MEVIDLFREEDTRDELGLGVIRDAFADLFFPGTSTIQTRARYFLFVPWVFQKVEQKQCASADAAAEIRKLQDRLRRALQEGGEERGVIGFRAGINVQRLPSSVYWQGLYRWGVLRMRGTEEDFVRQLDNFYLHTRTWRQQQNDRSGIEQGEAVDAPPINWDLRLPPPPPGWLDRCEFALTPDESAYLIDRIQMRFPRSLLAFILHEQEVVPEDVDYPWQQPGVLAATAETRQQLDHARRFSEVMHGAALLYNLLIAEQFGAIAKDPSEEWVSVYRAELAGWWERVAGDERLLHTWDLNAFQRVMTDQQARVTPRTWHFILRWVDLTRSASSIAGFTDDKVPRLHITEREQQLKGGRARLGNPRSLENWTGASGATQIDYRWKRPVRTIINELLQPSQSG